MNGRDRDPYSGLDVVETYEIKAEAFRLMTGLMAPGKSQSPLAHTHSDEERAQRWAEWDGLYGPVVRAVTAAYHNILPRDEQ